MILKKDGNPLLYALKQETNWFLDKKSDYFCLFRRFVYASKLIDDHFDTIVSVPSSNQLNQKIKICFNRIFKEKNLNVKCVKEILKKPFKEDVKEHLSSELVSELISKFGNYKKVLKTIDSWFEKMPGKYFRFHNIPKEFWKYIHNNEFFPEGITLDSAKYFNGKDVLILCDKIESDNSLNNRIHVILDTMGPKSVTFLTLFSPIQF